MKQQTQSTLALLSNCGLSDIEIEDVTHSLMLELRDIEGLSVERAEGIHPTLGSKGDPISATEIVIAFSSAAFGSIVPYIFEVLRDFCNRDSRDKLLFFIEIDGKKLEFRSELDRKLSYDLLDEILKINHD